MLAIVIQRTMTTSVELGNVRINIVRTARAVGFEPPFRSGTTPIGIEVVPSKVHTRTDCIVRTNVHLSAVVLAVLGLMPPGAFCVRPSSQANRLALSHSKVRLPSTGFFTVCFVFFGSFV